MAWSVLYPVSYKLEHERQLNAGLAKHFPYRSIVIGTSMTENFLISDVEKLIPEPIKLSLSGGTGREMYFTMHTAFAHRPVEKVLIGLDYFALQGSPDTFNPDMVFPVYLYDDDIWNDYPYLLSTDTLSSGFKAIFKPLLMRDDPSFSYEHMYEWFYKFKDHFAQGEALEQRWNGKPKMQKEALLTTKWRYEELKKNFSVNFLPFLQKHEKTIFYIFYPPYSRLINDYCKENNLTDEIDKFKKYVFDAIGKLDNVRLYDFQNAGSVTNNLDNYKDIIHYHQDINTWMIDQMLHNRYRVSCSD